MIIRATWLKVVLTIGFGSIAYEGLALLSQRVPDGVRLGVNIFVILLLFTLGVRVFRGRTEDRQRPYWRATGGPLSGYVVGCVAIIFSVGAVVSVTQTKGPVIDIVVPFVVWVGIAAFYIQSSIRLSLAKGLESCGCEIENCLTDVTPVEIDVF